MRAIRNTLFLYLSLLGGFILHFIQLKVLSIYLTPTVLGKFFTISAFGQLVSGLLILGIPFVLTRYLPKFHAQNEFNKMSSLLRLLVLSYFLLALIVYIFLFYSGYKLGLFIYKDEIIGKYLSFGFLVFSASTLFAIIFAAFNGLRKMHYSAGLNLLYLSILTFLVFWFRFQLSVLLVLKIHLISVIPSIVIGGSLLYREMSVSAKHMGRHAGLPLQMIKEITPYWKYAILLGFLTPLLFYLDRLIIGYFLTMNAVALFTVASKINWWVRRILSIPLDALTPEMSYSWTKDNKEVLGKDLGIIVKLNLLFGLAITTPVLIGGKDIILIITNFQYLDSFVPLFLMCLSIPLAAIYAPIATAMQSTGKMLHYFLINVVNIGSYLILILSLIHPFNISGVAIGYLSATFITLMFNILYIAKYHTFLKIDFNSIYKTVAFAIAFGLFTYLVFHFPNQEELWKLVWRLVMLGVFIFCGRLNR